VLHNLKDYQLISYLEPFREMMKNQKITDKVQRTTGPVSTYVRTNKKGDVKWGVRHFVGKKYAK
jgi:hypothetical protein